MSSPNQFLSPEGDLENLFITENWLIDQYIGDQLWIWGSPNGAGTLGNNTSPGIPISTPITTFAGGANWSQVSCGFDHVAAIKTDGTLWVWGQNTNGALGINNTNDRSTPVTTFAGGNDWKQVSCATNMTAAVKTDGTLWIWGHNFNGGIGNNSTTQRNTPVTTFAGGTNWQQVSSWRASNESTSAIKTDGTLWLWGSNGGQFGLNGDIANKSTPVTTFAGGNDWKQVSGNRAIKTDGTLWVWGSANNLGINASGIKSTPVTTFAGGNNWKQISNTGGNCSAAIKTDGTLWLWGAQGSGLAFGLLGTNDTINRSTPVTTFAGGNNWKQVGSGSVVTAAVFSGVDLNIPLG